MYQATIANQRFRFPDLRALMGAAGERKAGDIGAGIAARDELQRAAAKLALAEVRLSDFIDQPLIEDEVTATILAHHDREAFAEIAAMTVGELRELVLSPAFPPLWRAGLSNAITPEIAAAVAKLMSDKDLVLAAQPLRVVTRFRTTIGQPGVFAARIQPNHPTDAVDGILLSVLDGLLLGCGDALIGVNPVDDSVGSIVSILTQLRAMIETTGAPTQSCVLGHVSSQIAAAERGAPLDLIFQSIAGTEAANASFGVTAELLAQGREAALASRNQWDTSPGPHQVTYFETGQGSALSAGAHHGVDQLTLESRAQAFGKCFDPFLINSVVGFIGPEYLADAPQIIRAGLEDHFVGKLQGVPIGCDVCFTNHVDADQNSNDDLLMLLAVAGANYVMAVAAGDDVMLGYQSTSGQDVQAIRRLLNLHPAPEFERWLTETGIWHDGELRELDAPTLARMLGSTGALTAGRS